MPANNENRAGVDDLGGPQAWYDSLPFVTKYWFTGALVLTCAGNFGMIKVLNLIYSWESLKDKFEIWRLVTCFCYVGKFDITTLFGLYMLVNFGKIYESSPYNTGGGGGTADFVFMMMFGMVVMLCTYPFLVKMIPPLFTRNLIYYVLYVWSKQNPTAPASIWGIQLKAMYLPFAYLALTVLLGNPYWDIIHGIAVGHAYYFLVEVVPLMYNKDFIHTPQFLIDFFGPGAYVPPAPARAGMEQGQGGNVWQAPGRAQPPRDPAGTGRNRGGGYNWGSGGRSLGTS